jgi:hypothetical protein
MPIGSVLGHGIYAAMAEESAVESAMKSHE